MTIDWPNFTPMAAATGGIILGLAAAALALCNGRIAGISGIVGGLLRPVSGDLAWRVAFIVGLLVAPLAFRAIAPLPSMVIAAKPGTLILAGLLVGLGTRYGGGCTSGHGVCGMSRLSPRSLVATLSFMAAGFITVYVVRHLVG